VRRHSQRLLCFAQVAWPFGRATTRLRPAPGGLSPSIYDPLLLATGHVGNTAQTECAKFQRVAVHDHVDNGKTWTKIAEFRCEDRTAMATAGTTYRSLPPPPLATTALIPAPQPSHSPAVTVSAGSVGEGGVYFIDAIGPNWGVTHRQVAKAPIAKLQAVKPLAAGTPGHTSRGRVASEHSLKASNFPIANLKGSIVS
jgi:hypothetical protein